MDIVEEIRQDREKGAKMLESEYKAGLMALARRFCPNPSDAEELVNATFATVVANIDDYLEQSAFFAWMCQILTSLHTRNIRRKSNQEIVFPGTVADAVDEAAEEEIYRNLDRALVRDALQKLEAEDREVLLLHYFLDIPVVKMAKVLAIPAGTVKSRLHYARKALAAKLGVAAKKPGGKALLIALALAALTTMGAAVWHLAVSDEAKNCGQDVLAPAVADAGDDVAGGDARAPAANQSSTPSAFDFDQTTQEITNMNASTLRSLAAPFAALALAAPAQAKTIALWPMELGPDSGTFYGTNAIGTAHGLSLVNGSSDVGPNWTLPSNPDASAMAFSPLNGGTAIAGVRGGSAKYTMEATGSFGDRVSNTNEFTAEGWVKIAANPSQSADYGLGKSWTIILQSGCGSSAKQGGWILSWRGDAGARKFWLTVPADNNNANNYDGAIGKTLSAAFETAMADSWHHLALTHKVEGGQDVWKLYIDGDNTIEGEEATVRKGQSGAFAFGNYRNLYFGGRPESNANRLNASFDYWRVSDKALDPSEFLCAAAAAPGSGESMVACLGPEGSTHSQWISTGVSLKGDARKTCTVEIWAYPLSGLNIDQQFIEQFGTGNGRMNLNRRASDGKLRMWMGGYEGAEMFSASAIPLDTWTHVAWVADGDTWRLYINGELDSESTGHTDHLLDAGSADGFVIGNTRSSNPNGMSNAYFAEARVWKCARTGAEIKAAMGKRIENAWNIPNLIGYWPLSDGPVDYTLNGNKARNYAVLNPTQYTPSGAANFNYSYAAGNRVGWVSSALPVTGTLQSEQSAIYNAGIRTNAVDTLVNATPDAFTVMGWYLVNSSRAGLDNDLFDKMKVANGRMRFNETNGALRFWLGGGQGGGKTNEEFVVANCMPIGAWTHVALTKNGGTVKIYVNGELVGENNAFTMGICDANLCVGGFYIGSSFGSFNGAFRNVGFWSKAMGAEKIKAHMYALPDPADEKLLSYWPLDEGEGNSVRNLKSGGLPGQPVDNGFFQWNKGANMPVIAGTVKPSAFVISIR